MGLYGLESLQTHALAAQFKNRVGAQITQFGDHVQPKSLFGLRSGEVIITCPVWGASSHFQHPELIQGVGFSRRTKSAA